jgi:hypothetical protein
LGFCAELRRELRWGNLRGVVFCVLGVCPRRLGEEGGQLMFLCVWGNFVEGIVGGFYLCGGLVGVWGAYKGAD